MPCLLRLLRRTAASVHRLIMLVRIVEFLVPETTDDMIVYHANRLHERVTNCFPNELESSFLQIFAHGFRLRSAGGNIGHLFHEF